MFISYKYKLFVRDLKKKIIEVLVYSIKSTFYSKNQDISLYIPKGSEYRTARKDINAVLLNLLFINLLIFHTK